MYKTHTLEEYGEVMKLRKKGLSLPKIFSFLKKEGRSIKKGTISDWIYTDKRPFQDKVLSKILPQLDFLTMEKAYILGVLCGDGYIRVSKSNQYLVGLDVIDEDFADEFASCLIKVYGLIPSKSKRHSKVTNFTNNAKPRYCVNLSSKLVVQDLLKYSDSFKTKEWTVPNEVLESNSIIKSAFLRGLFDSDGSVSLRKPRGAYLYVCSANKSPLLKIDEMLKNDFDINLSFVQDRNIVKLKSSGYKNVKNYYDKINFTIERKRNKLEEGLFVGLIKPLRSLNRRIGI